MTASKILSLREFFIGWLFAHYAEGLPAYVYVLLQLDAGLRGGEALGLRWGDVSWGDDE